MEGWTEKRMAMTQGLNPENGSPIDGLGSHCPCFAAAPPVEPAPPSSCPSFPPMTLLSGVRFWVRAC